MEHIREFIIGEFRGTFPQIDVSARVDMDALTEGDEDPFFVTLPVARVGETSRNGLLYDEELVRAIEQQLVGKGGIMGHIKPDERNTAFPIEDVDWVGVKRVGETTWAKAYVPPGEARGFIRRLMARGGKLATSIYGRGKREALPDDTYRMRPFQLEQLDLAPADRAALQLGGEFAVTAQMETDDKQEKEPEMDKAQILAELTADDVPATVREAILTEYKAQTDERDQVAELEQQVTDKDAVIETLQDQLAQIREREFEAELDGKVAELVDWPAKTDEAKEKVNAFRRMVRQRIVAELNDDRDNLDEAAETAWDEMKPLAETLRNALAGPAAVVNGTVRGRKLEDTPEARQKARAAMGL